MEGTIKEFKRDKKYGFIVEDNKVEGENEIFFHFSEIKEKEFEPTKGSRVIYDSVESEKVINGKAVMNAVNIKSLERYYF